MLEINDWRSLSFMTDSKNAVSRPSRQISQDSMHSNLYMDAAMFHAPAPPFQHSNFRTDTGSDDENDAQPGGAAASGIPHFSSISPHNQAREPLPPRVSHQVSLTSPVASGASRNRSNNPQCNLIHFLVNNIWLLILLLFAIRVYEFYKAFLELCKLMYKLLILICFIFVFVESVAERIGNIIRPH